MSAILCIPFVTCFIVKSIIFTCICWLIKWASFLFSCITSISRVEVPKFFGEVFCRSTICLNYKISVLLSPILHVPCVVYIWWQVDFFGLLELNLLVLFLFFLLEVKTRYQSLKLLTLIPRHIVKINSPIHQPFNKCKHIY